MAMNPWVGWSLSTLALWFLNGNSSSDSASAEDKPEELSITETKTGTPVPVIMGRVMVKSPLTIFYGDFRADRYTETYSAHAEFNAGALVFSLIAVYIASLFTGHQATPAAVTATGGNSAGPVNSTGTATGATYKDDLTGPLINTLFMFLLSWLINGRNLKTTMQKGFKYYLGYQQLVAWSSEGMRLRSLWMGKVKVWEGDESREAHHPNPLDIRINNDELFGGVDEGGGFVGNMHVYLGGSQQVVDPWMVAQMQASTVQQELRGLTPAYRPFVSLVVPQAYVGKSATIPETWMELQFIPNRLGLGAIGEDANPAEILYEIHVNNNWGLGQPSEYLDVDSLISAGNKLKAEGLGISVTLSNKTTARTVIDSICDHVNMVRYQDPQTGKLTYKLIRDDYSTEELVVLNQSNCGKISFSRLDWRETVGEICITYTDRNAQYEQSSINDNDPAVIEMAEGNKVTKTYDFPYFTIAENALWAARREAYQQGYPLATGSITGDRRLYAIRTGQVCLLTWEPYGIKNLPIRITDVDLGDFVNGNITLEFMEDMFGLGKGEYGFSGSTGWKVEDKYPTGVQDFRYLELPYEMIPDKDTHVFAMAPQPNVNTVKWTIWRNKAGLGWTTTNSMVKWTPAARLVYECPEFGDQIDMVGIEVMNIFGMEDLVSSTLANGAPDITGARNGTNLLVVNNEVMSWSSVQRAPSGNWLIRGLIRGVYDTVPQKHNSGSTIFFLVPQTYANVTTGGPVCKKGLTVDEYYNITTTSVTNNTEEFDPNKTTELITVRRSERPNPPGCFKMRYDGKPDAIRYEEVQRDVTFSWIHRNKVYQTYGIAAQSDAVEVFTGSEYTLPAGAEYVIKAFVLGTKVGEYTTTDQNWKYTWAQRCKDSDLHDTETLIEVYTKQDGLESYQPQRRFFNWEMPLMINACETQAEIEQFLMNWGNANLITVPSGSYSSTFYREYSRLNIFILGTRVADGTVGAVLSQEGYSIMPNGKVAFITGQNAYEVVDVDEFYTFESRFTQENAGGDIRYVYHPGGVTSG
jgi:hypothetical protein